MNKKNIPKNGEVDVVYIWCDANHPEYIKNRKKYSREYSLNSFWSPTRDHNEILYSIRSVRKNMDWVRKIFICCPKGHRVKNLDTEKYGIEYIDNEVILGEENCPNFNSHSLELFIHKIPGLSEYYIEFMDDLFIGAKVGLEDFYDFETGKIKYYYENTLLLGPPFSPLMSSIIQDLSGEKYYFWATHSPKMFFKQDIMSIVSKYSEDSLYTQRAKFRTEKDFQLVYMYGYYIQGKNTGDFIFLQNIIFGSNILHSFKILISKIFSENLLSVLNQAYLQIVYKKKLYSGKTFLYSKMYSLIQIGDDSERNKRNIDFAIENNIKFICLNDGYNKSSYEKIYKENYEYFYNLI